MLRSCSWIRERLGVLRDGELPAGETAEVNEHLAVCASCRLEQSEIEMSDAMLRAADPSGELDPAAEARSLARVLDRLAVEPEPAWTRSGSPSRGAWGLGGWLRSAWGVRVQWASGIAVAAAAVLLAMRMSGPDPRILDRRPEPALSGKPPGTEYAAPPAIVAAPDSGAGADVSRRGAPPPEQPSQARSSIEEDGRISTESKLDAGAVATGDADAARAVLDESQPGPDRATQDAPRDAEKLGEAVERLEVRVPLESGPPLVEVQVRPADPDEDDLRADEPPPRSVAFETRPSRGGAREPAPPTANRDKTGTETPARTDSEGSVPSHVRGGRMSEIRNLYVDEGGEARSRAHGADLDSLRMSTEGLRSGLLRAEALLESDPRDSAERAREWSRIGDYWEYLGRMHAGPPAHDRAVRAYERAMSLDPNVVIDAARLARARAAIATPPPPRERQTPSHPVTPPRKDAQPSKESSPEREERPRPRPGDPARPPGR